MLRTLSVLLAFSLVAVLAACDRGKPAGNSAPVSAAPLPAGLPANLFLAAAPADAKEIKDTKPTLKPGDKITLTGRIGGSGEPFVAERAIFTLVDGRLKACGEGNPDDNCPTPWDYCCESRTDITANSTTVQVVGADGQPIKAELNGLRGLKPLARVTIVGIVAKAEGELCVVNASGVYVSP